MPRIKLPPSASSIAAIVYAVVMVFLKWGTELTFDAVFLVVGILIGLVLLDVVDSLFPSAKPLLHSVVGAVIIGIAGFFVVTSSGSILGSGVVLSLLLRVLSEQITEYMATGQIMSWFATKQSVLVQQLTMVVSMTMLLLFSYIFITLP